jgi:hypothetical protein
MIHHFNCHSSRAGDQDPLVLDWDDETGEVTGPGADFVLAVFRDGIVGARPEPWSWNLTSTKNRTDMAAVIGSWWVLPKELAADYPKQEDDDDPYFRDMDGNRIGKVVY